MSIDDVAVARAVHVIAVVLWIGGVGFVTTVLLPAVRLFKAPQQRVRFFESVEKKFAWQARATTLLVGISGFYITAVWDLWDRFFSIYYWWMHAMVVVWLVFTAMLFVAEPLFLHSRFLQHAEKHPEKVFRLIERLHWVLLSISLIALAGAVLGSHGVSFFS